MAAGHAPPAPSQQCLRPPALRWDMPEAPPRRLPRCPGLRPRTASLPLPRPDPRDSPLARGGAEGGLAAAGRRRAATQFHLFSCQTRLRTGLSCSASLLLHGAMRLGGGSRRSWARGGRTRARTVAGRRRPLRRRKRRGRRRRPGRTRGIPRAAGGLSRAGTRVLRYPSSHRRQ
ncbi:PREDICTED: uncharacterized protein LOC108533014 [Rhinopithecus bieti]|uniref:uncharacterized protein LOC108533014 n=1 Tax=Rhinopithecus bieti TaxID=61621 RepID=UPI00083C006C|nr:PREDICTED: uncharacterized protein LOC108533014 [Rhinopithecus bieti]